MDSSHQMFFVTSTFLQKGGQVPKASCPRGQHASYANPYPAQEAFKLCLKDLKTSCISFSFARIRDASFAVFTFALVDQGIGCLWFACCFSQGPALLPGCASSCLPSNKKCCAHGPTHGEGEGLATYMWAPPGIQDQD